MLAVLEFSEQVRESGAKTCHVILAQKKELEVCFKYYVKSLEKYLSR